MVLSHPHPSQSKIFSTLAYFDKYDYPLTWSEIRYWSSIPLPRSPSPIIGEGRGEVYFLPGRSHIVKLRQQRAKFSQTKWQIAKQVGVKLKKFPFIAAVFVTGALAMNNCPADDDIDLMIVTYPSTLWITRLFVNLYLHQTRRFPRQSRAPDKICPNLWLDLNHLALHTHNLYVAHEILQAKVLWDRAGVQYQFLKQNKWVKNYLPNAFKVQGAGVANASRAMFKVQRKNYLLWPVNLIFYLVQYLYMRPKMTTEKVGLGYAFFHPRTASIINS